ncbi:NlpC/P60 family protein [Jatrophihabitans sp. GAS493]|uniref:C40 family peptidase n=1 Tax=Jatrophihabitans sp. GAS493 TaxID=1907575 RepID=UPI000BB75BC1|nr:NlpC/P60 family protein [Jatrophihabitans sp. GAS493]SOD72934.1 NlpC/P60 family protein [Jatrophihabitans sp. GAS493]
MGARGTITAAAGAVAAVFSLIIVVPTVLLGGGVSQAAAGAAQQAAAGGSCTYTPAAAGGAVAAGITLTASQLQIAGAGVAVAKQRNLPVQASIDILAAGMQESHLTNLAGGDRDSVGWLQQRPSQGWGTVAQIVDPVYAAGKFLDHLVLVAHWQELPPAQVIQDVQISSDGSLYAQWVPMATAVAASLLGDPSVALSCSVGGGGGAAPGQAPNAAVGRALARGQSALGLPYCFDGGTATGPSHGVGGRGCEGQAVGFDCSGLALYMWAAAGVYLDHSSASQYTSPNGVLVPITQVQPGDLVFLSSDGMIGGIHHTAIIWSVSGKSDGSGQIIEAQDFDVPVHIRAWAGAHEREVMPYALRMKVTN